MAQDDEDCPALPTFFLSFLPCLAVVGSILILPQRMVESSLTPTEMGEEHIKCGLETSAGMPNLLEKTIRFYKKHATAKKKLG